MGNADKTFEIGIKTTGDTSGAEAVKKSLSGVGSAAEGLKSVGTTFGLAELSMAGAAAAAVNFVTSSLSAAQEAQEAHDRLNISLANTGQYSAAAGERIEELAEQLQNLTNISDETWTDAASSMVQFGVKAEELEDLFPILEGLAGRMGGNVAGAADVLGRALAGNTRGLAQFGIQLEEGATRAEILEAVTEAAAKGMGLLEAKAQTTAGRTEALSVAWGDLQENFGKTLSQGGGLSGLLNILTQSVQYLSKHIEEVIATAEGVSPALGIFMELGKLFGNSGDKAAELAAKSAAVTPKLNAIADAEDTLKGKAKGAAGEISAETKAMEAQGAEIERLIKHTADLAKIKEGDKARADELTKAKLEKDKATVDAAEKAKKITPEKAAVARENLESWAQDEMFQRSQAAKAAEIKQNETLLSQLEEQRRLAQNSFSNKDDDGTRKAKEAELAKASGAEQAQREKNAIENARLQAEIATDERVNQLKQEARRTGAVSGVIEAREKEAAAAEKAATREEAAAARVEKAKQNKNDARQPAAIKHSTAPDTESSSYKEAPSVQSALQESAEQAAPDHDDEGLGKSGRGYRDKDGRFHIRRRGRIDGRAKADPRNIDSGLAGANNEAPLRARPDANDGEEGGGGGEIKKAGEAATQAAGKFEAGAGQIATSMQQIDTTLSKLVTAMAGVVSKLGTLDNQIASLQTQINNANS